MLLAILALVISYDFSPDTNFNRHFQTTNVCLLLISSSKRTNVIPTHWAGSRDSLALSYSQATKKWAEKTMFICRPISETKDPLCRPASEFNSKSTKTLEAFSLFQGEHRDTKNIQKTHNQGPNPTELVFRRNSMHEEECIIYAKRLFQTLELAMRIMYAWFYDMNNTSYIFISYILYTSIYMSKSLHIIAIACISEVITTIINHLPCISKKGWACPSFRPHDELHDFDLSVPET